MINCIFFLYVAALIGCGISIVVVGFMHCEQRVQAVVLICLISFFFNFGKGGSACSPSDVAPRSAARKFKLIQIKRAFIVQFYIHNYL